MQEWEFHSQSEAHTEALGAALAGALRPGTVIALEGELGAGKTRLVQAVAVAFGVDRRDVTSPTFVLVQEYAGRTSIYHIDAYRLGGIEEFLDLGAEELLASESICLIEWADRIEAALPADRLRVRVEMTGPESRRFRFSGSGAKSEKVVERLRSGAHDAGGSVANS